MSLGPEWPDLGKKSKLFVIWALSLLIDSAFFVLWITIQFIISDYIIRPLQPHLLDTEKHFLSAFQNVFAVGTFTVIAIYICVDIGKMIMQAWQAIRNQQDKK
jgi:cellobiose-specific phosphotransferase system component IIC